MQECGGFGALIKILGKGSETAMNPYTQYMYSYPHKTAYRPLPAIPLATYAPFLAGTGHSLYLHLPFCQAKCGYCNLFSVTAQGKTAIGRYLDALERQCRQYAKVLEPVQTVFSEFAVGGGTPLYLPVDQLVRAFSIVQTYFAFAPGLEFAVETAPNQTSAEKLEVLKQAGVTRVSMGIQSFSDQELNVLGRVHRADEAREALGLLKAYGFACINVDFIYGIAGQTAESLLDSLKEALEYGPDEIFLYPLYVSHGSGMQLQGAAVDAQAAASQYQSASRFLRGQGYRQDSMRRFVRGQGVRAFSECGFGSSLGLGCGARSYLGNLHFCSPYAVEQEECLEQIASYGRTRDFTKIMHGFLLSEEEEKRRYLIRHLFISPGISLQRYKAQFQSSVMEDFPVLRQWMEAGYVCRERRMAAAPGEAAAEQPVPAVERGKQAGCPEEWLVMSAEGLALSDYLGPQLISGQVQKAMEEWEVQHGQAHDGLPGQPEKL